MPKRGFVTASQTSCLLVNGSTRPPFGRGAVTYSRQLARDMYDIETEEFHSDDIDRGNELEAAAIACFERTMFVEINRPDFMVHPEIDFFGGTPDGLATDFGMDAKCPNQKNHHDNLGEGMQLGKYKAQFQSYMAITGLDRWALASYNPSFTKNTQMVVAWMDRDEGYIEMLLDRVKKFHPIVMEELEQLKNYNPKKH